MATLKQVAERAGVSRRTVDRVINNRGIVNPETEARVREALKELEYRPDETGQTLAAKKKDIHLAFCSLKGAAAVFHAEIRRGAKEKAKELERLGITVDFYDIDRDRPLKKEESDRFFETFSCDGMAIVPDKDPTIQKLMEVAQEKNIPTVFYNIDNTAHKRDCYVGCDYRKSGRMAAGLLGLNMGAPIKVGIFTVGVVETLFESPNYKHRVEGFEQELKKCCPDALVVGQYLVGNDVFDCYETMKQAFTAHPDMNAVYLVNPGDYSACRAIRKAAGERKLRLITNDLTGDAVDLLKEGVISATISQDPECQGSLPLQLLFEMLVFGRKPEKEKYYTELRIFVPQSIDI